MVIIMNSLSVLSENHSLRPDMSTNLWGGLEMGLAVTFRARAFPILKDLVVELPEGIALASKAEAREGCDATGSLTQLAPGSSISQRVNWDGRFSNGFQGSDLANHEVMLHEIRIFKNDLHRFPCFHCESFQIILHFILDDGNLNNSSVTVI